MKTRKIVAGVVGIVGTLALLAGLHHIVVVTARGTMVSAAFAGTCHWCHGDTYEGFGASCHPWTSNNRGGARGLHWCRDPSARARGWLTEAAR